MSLATLPRLSHSPLIAFHAAQALLATRSAILSQTFVEATAQAARPAISARRAQHEHYKAIRQRLAANAFKPEPKPVTIVVTRKPETAPLLEVIPPLPVKPLTRLFVATARHFGLTLSKLRAKSHERRFVRPRQIAFYLASKHRLCGTPSIGRHAGGFDHTTVLHGIRKIEQLIAAGDQSIIDAIAAIEAAYARH